MVTPSPVTPSEVCELLTCARTKGECVERIDLSALNDILEHRPEDMTVTVEAGITLRALQQEIGTKGQWLPIDPPNSDQLPLNELISRNLSGPRRYGFGTIRDWLIGIRVALPDGTLIRSGGKVVKNVAGYDLMKAFIGSEGTLGIIVEATFKLRPLPEQEAFVSLACENLEQAEVLLEQLVQSDISPSVLDLHRMAVSSHTLVVGFSGTKEEVTWQLELAAKLGITDKASLEYHEQFGAFAPNRLSVLPSKLTASLANLRSDYVARAGNGVIYHRDAASPAPLPNVELMRRLKNTFDPHGTLPKLPSVK